MLEAGHRRFCDWVEDEWLLQMVAPRVADRRILRLIRR